MLEIFREEIMTIKTVKIRNLVWNCLEQAPDYFWRIPSSSTGKYHPADEFTEGGLVLHTKRVFNITDHICGALRIRGIERDCVLAAALMHDLCKNGYPEDTGHTVDGHGYLWTELARTKLTKKKFLAHDDYSTISRLILYHMGPFDMPYILDWSDTLATCVYLADYLASRRNILVDINPQEIINTVVGEESNE